MLAFRMGQEEFGSEFSYCRTVGCGLVFRDMRKLELRQQLVDIF